MTQEAQKRKKGGPQPGSGRPKGRLNQSTLDAMQVKQAYLERIRKNADKLFNAQFSNAVGTQMLFVIKTDSKGVRRKPEMVTDPEIISQFLDENEGMSGTLGNDKSEYFFMTTAKPDTQSLRDMLDRAMGKAQEHIDLTTKGREIRPPKIISIIKARNKDADTTVQ